MCEAKPVEDAYSEIYREELAYMIVGGGPSSASQKSLGKAETVGTR